MRFFEHQREARRQSRRLSFFFALIIIGQVLLLNGALLLPAVAWAKLIHLPLHEIGSILPRHFFAVNTAVALLYILGGWWLESSRLADGGKALAHRIGAIPAQRSENNRGNAAADMAQLQYTDIVQEMAIAANLRPPAAFLLPNDQSINAFAAGWDEKDSIICVTQGALDHLSRDELSGLIAHELSHIHEGDTRLNMRLAGMVLGLEMLYNLGCALMNEANEGILAAFGIILGPLLRGVGYVGWLAARIMKAAISREREYLADARAVQYTRQKDGLGATLRKVLWQHERQGMDFDSIHPAVQHMQLVGAWADTAQLLQTHPPLEDRIRRIYGHIMPALKPETGREHPEWKNPFADDAADAARTLGASHPTNTTTTTSACDNAPLPFTLTENQS